MIIRRPKEVTVADIKTVKYLCVGGYTDCFIVSVPEYGAGVPGCILLPQ